MAVLTVRDKVHKPSDWYRQLSVHGIILNVIHSNLYKNQWKEETENLPPTQQNKNFVELGGGRNGVICLLEPLGTKITLKSAQRWLV